MVADLNEHFEEVPPIALSAVIIARMLGADIGGASEKETSVEDMLAMGVVLPSDIKE